MSDDNKWAIKKTDVPTDVSFFGSSGTEILKICENGDIFVKGKLIQNDREVYVGLCEALGVEVKNDRPGRD